MVLSALASVKLQIDKQTKNGNAFKCLESRIQRYRIVPRGKVLHERNFYEAILLISPIEPFTTMHMLPVHPTQSLLDISSS